MSAKTWFKKKLRIKCSLNAPLFFAFTMWNTHVDVCLLSLLRVQNPQSRPDIVRRQKEKKVLHKARLILLLAKVKGLTALLIFHVLLERERILTPLWGLKKIEDNKLHFLHQQNDRAPIIKRSKVRAVMSKVYSWQRETKQKSIKRENIHEWNDNSQEKRCWDPDVVKLHK